MGILRLGALHAHSNLMGGLVPEWGNVDGSVDNNYGYNACRTPWRVAVDFLWFCTPAAKTFLDHVSTYVDSKGGVASVPFDGSRMRVTRPARSYE